MLHLPPMQTRQKVDQAKEYFSAVEAMKDTKGCRLGRGKSWMGQAEDSVLQVSSWQTSSKPRSGKGTQTDSGVSTRHSCQKTWESTVENGQQAKQSKRSSFSFKKTANRKTL